MLQVCGLIHYFFRLVRGVFPDFLPDTIHKGLRFSETATQKGFGFVIGGEHSCLIFELTFVLLLAEKGLILEE